MSNTNVHCEQASHNESLAIDLVGQPPFHDWAVTCGFYAAIHMFEAWHRIALGTNSDASKPINYTHHDWREQRVKDLLQKGAWKAFRRLRIASNCVRYLYNSNMGSSVALPVVAYVHVSAVEATSLVKSDLGLFSKEVSHDLVFVLSQCKSYVFGSTPDVEIDAVVRKWNSLSLFRDADPGALTAHFGKRLPGLTSELKRLGSPFLKLP